MMNKSLTFAPTVSESKKFRKFLQQGLAEMDRLFELMANDQKEIDWLAFSTQTTLSEIRTISERTDAILETLKTA